MIEHCVGIDVGTTHTRVGIKAVGADKIHYAPSRAGIVVVEMTDDSIADAVVNAVTYAANATKIILNSVWVVVGFPAIQMTETDRRLSLRTIIERKLSEAGIRAIVVVVSNWRPPLFDLCQDNLGTLVSIGSGSVAVYQEPKASGMVWHRAGGFGPAIGDPGSGITLSRRGLQQLGLYIEQEVVGHFNDKPSILYQIAEGLGIKTKAAMNEYVRKNRIQAFTVPFMEAVSQGDERCGHILEEELDVLIDQIRHSLPITDEIATIPFGLVGGLTQNAEYLRRLKIHILKHWPGIVINQHVDAVRGAIAMAEAELAD